MKKRSLPLKKRLLIVVSFIAIAFVLIIGRLVGLQVVDAEDLQLKALKQQTRDTSITASRGRILDADGVVLAQSGTVYKVLAWPQVIPDSEVDRIASELANVLGLEKETVLKKITTKAKNGKAVKEVVIARQVERETVDAIKSLKLGNGVVTAVDTKRYYPYGSLLSQIIGFTNIDSDGQSGLELTYNKYLAGENGRMITEADRDGKSLPYGIQEYLAQKDGCDLVLTTKTTVQSFLEKNLEEALKVNNASNAQGIIMNCKTGEIIAMSTKPDYDLNNPPRSDLELLSALSRNRIVADAYEPGSTFKIITLSAALDSNTISDGFTANCPGYRMVSGQRIKCWKAGGHGHQSLTECTENSCNCAFMDMALALGTEELYNYIYAFGFGATTGSGIVGESSGIVIHEKYIRDINLARIGFGQSVAVTPIQLASAVSAAVNGGTLYKPTIVKQVISSDGTVVIDNKPEAVRQVISGETSAKVRKILESVVENGSGRNAQIPGYRVGGKTGTAQKYDDTGVAAGKLIASFIGFAPADDPQFVVLILVDEPKVGSIFGSTVAAPFVKNVLEETLRYYGYLESGHDELVTVPDLTGLTTKQAAEALQELGIEAVYQENDEVTAQVPSAGTKVLKGTSVLLYTANTDIVPEDDDTDTEKVKVPDLSGMTRLEAYDALKAVGLIMEIEGTYSGGYVRVQSIEKGTMVRVGTVIKVVFSTKTGDE